MAAAEDSILETQRGRNHIIYLAYVSSGSSANFENMVIVSSTKKAGSKPHLTARLVLELMAIDSTAQRSRSRSSYAAGASSPSPRTSENTPGSNVQHLQQLLMQAGCPGCSEISTSSEGLLWSSRTALATSNEGMTIRHNEDSVETDDTCSWGEDDECEEFDFDEDRGRLFANVGAQGSSSDESVFASAGSPSERRNTHESEHSKR